MSKIREILNKFNINGHDKLGGTDKDSCHSYVEIHEQFLEPILEKEGSLLEIGVHSGGSILLWNELLKNCRIFGIDIQDILHDNIREYVKDYPKKITLEFRDAYCKETIDHIKFIYPIGFDVIIDDGPHTEESQLKCIDLYLDLLKDDGVLIIEDIQNFDSIKVFIENIPKSKFFDYEPLVFDLRDKKNTYDDVIFAIKKKVKKEEFIEPLSLTHKKTKIVMISMFKNEAHNIKQMLESCYKYIDFWILQDNGSTDGTPEVVNDFFKDKNIPGFIYQVEEGWMGFGWNRDHLLQKCQSTDHGCDWILKMDCDETLEVDNEFDWSLFSNTEIQSFNVVATGGGMLYYRTWIWNAKLPWRFNHDTAHETIYLDVDYLEDKQAFQRVALPKEFRQVGHNTGESWSVPTKFLTDALIFEERLIRENTLLENRYHFFYIGKSYEDTYEGDFFPLGKSHSEEFARRCIFYFEEYIHQVHDFKNTKEAKHMDEMSYHAICGIARAYKFLGNISKSIFYYEKANNFCPRRNEHLIGLAESYNLMGEHNKMLEITNILMSPERTCPFPDLCFLLNSNLYYDTGQYPEYLHNIALQNTNN